MLVFRERVETSAVREKPLGGEKRTTTLNSRMTPSQTVLSQLNWDQHAMEASWRKDSPVSASIQSSFQCNRENTQSKA